MPASRLLLVTAVLSALVLTGCATASTPEAAPTPTDVRPTATPTPTPTPSAGPLLDADCDALLALDEVSLIVEATASSVPTSATWNPAVLGGLSCRWQWEPFGGLDVAAYPIAVAEESQLPVGRCDPSTYCEMTITRNGVWIVAGGYGFATEDAQSVVSQAAEAAAAAFANATPAPPQALPATAWTLPDCDAILTVVQSAIELTGTQRFQDASDNLPSGAEWELLTRQGAAGWCAWFANGPDGRADLVEIFFAPGTSDLRDSADPGVAIDVDGAEAAVVLPATASDLTTVRAVTRDNALSVGGRYRDASEMSRVAAALIAYLDGR